MRVRAYIETVCVFVFGRAAASEVFGDDWPLQDCAEFAQNYGVGALTLAGGLYPPGGVLSLTQLPSTVPASVAVADMVAGTFQLVQHPFETTLVFVKTEVLQVVLMMRTATGNYAVHCASDLDDVLLTCSAVAPNTAPRALAGASAQNEALVLLSRALLSGEHTFPGLLGVFAAVPLKRAGGNGGSYIAELLPTQTMVVLLSGSQYLAVPATEEVLASTAGLPRHHTTGVPAVDADDMTNFFKWGMAGVLPADGNAGLAAVAACQDDGGTVATAQDDDFVYHGTVGLQEDTEFKLSVYPGANGMTTTFGPGAGLEYLVRGLTQSVLIDRFQQYQLLPLACNGVDATSTFRDYIVPNNLATNRVHVFVVNDNDLVGRVVVHNKEADMYAPAGLAEAAVNRLWTHGVVSKAMFVIRARKIKKRGGALAMCRKAKKKLKLADRPPAPEHWDEERKVWYAGLNYGDLVRATGFANPLEVYEAAADNELAVQVLDDNGDVFLVRYSDLEPVSMRGVVTGAVIVA